MKEQQSEYKSTKREMTTKEREQSTNAQRALRKQQREEKH